MPLTLLVASYGGSASPESASKRFDREGGTIGRVLSNALVLPDRQLYISKTHARIDFWDGGYYVTHLGKNPTELNGQELERDRPEQLSNGDRLSIGDYELLVEIEPEAGLHHSAPPASEWRHDGAQDDVSQPGPLMPLEAGNRQLSALGVNLSGDQIDANDASFRRGWLSADLIGTGADSPVARGAPSSASGGPSALPGAVNRRNYNPLTDAEEDPSAPASQARPSSPDKPLVQPNVMADTAFAPFTGTDLQALNPAGSVKSTEAGNRAPALPPRAETFAVEGPGASNAEARAVMLFLEAAGVPQLASKIRDAPALFSAAGELLREAVEGLQAVLLTRALVKGELRVDATMLAPNENNPLKTMPNATEVLSYLLASHEHSGYLPPLKALHDAFEDVQAHNMAVIAGMRAALQGVLRRYDPAEVEKRLRSNSLLENVLPGVRKARMWDLVNQMRPDADDDFDRTFGATFRQAYNQEVKRLRSEKRERLPKA